MEIGIRDLRNHLSKYLDEVRAGNELVVTDRGRAIARLVPLDEERPIDRLIAEGLIAPATARRSRPKRRIESQGSVEELIREQRR